MKKATYVFAALILSLTMNSCFSGSGENILDKIVAPPVKYEVVEIEELYSIKIPEFMSVTTELQEDASLQYNNPFKEKYIIVLDEEKEEILSFMKDYGVYDESKSQLENYVDTRLSYLTESGIVISKRTELKSEMINGRKAYSTVIDANAPDVSQEITYFFTYLEGKDHFYMISSWTLFDRKDAYVEEVQSMVKSFKEL